MVELVKLDLKFWSTIAGSVRRSLLSSPVLVTSRARTGVWSTLMCAMNENGSQRDHSKHGSPWSGLEGTSRKGFFEGKVKGVCPALDFEQPGTHWQGSGSKHDPHLKAHKMDSLVKSDGF